MSSSNTRPWWPADPSAAGALAVRLHAEAGHAQLFELSTVAAASQEWDIFAAVMAALCDVSVRSIRNMLDNAKFDSGWGILYGHSGMPGDLYPLFIEVLKVARKFFPNQNEPASRALRVAVMQQALSSPDLRGLKLPVELKAALLA